MEYINGYKAEESLYTQDGKEISVLRLEVENEEKVLDEWATHFREQYRYMEDLDFERHGTRRTRQEHLRDYVFPSDSVRPGPSIRVGDFCEILVADYIEFVCNYYVPRIRYRDKFNRNTSPHGSDVLGFKMRKKASTKDEALVFEVKGTSSPTGNPKGYKRLQDAIDDSSKDLLRYSETLNATKMRLYRMGRTEEAERIERFQNKTDIPYILKYGAAAVLTEEKFITSDMINVTTERHIDNVELIVIYTKDLNSLIDGMYRRAAIC